MGEGDTSYLQRELGSVLPIALAAVVELQPSDPIAMLALWLHKFRVSWPSSSSNNEKYKNGGEICTCEISLKGGGKG